MGCLTYRISPADSAGRYKVEFRRSWFEYWQTVYSPSGARTTHATIEAAEEAIHHHAQDQRSKEYTAKQASRWKRITNIRYKKVRI